MRMLNAQFLADEMYRHPSVKSLRYMMMLYDEAGLGSRWRHSLRGRCRFGEVASVEREGASRGGTDQCERWRVASDVGRTYRDNKTAPVATRGDTAPRRDRRRRAAT